MEVLSRICFANANSAVILKKTAIRLLNLSGQNQLVLLPHSRNLTSSRILHQKKEEDPAVSSEKDNDPFYHDHSLPHFRKSLQQKAEADLPNPSGMGSAPSVKENTLHPDAIEALSMQDGGYRLPHPVWNSEELESVRITHKPPVTRTDKLAYMSVMLLRRGFDLFSGYTIGNYRGTLDEKKWLRRIIFLETIAGVPGMVGAMVRHLISLRKMKRDHGWIHTLLEEAENERMHLMTAMRVARPGILMRGSIMLAQGIFVPTFSLAYFISPAFCHRFVGYLEEEAVKTYTNCLKAIDDGELKMWCRMKAPEMAVEYWKLPEDAMMRDVILAIRADEAHHRAVNHTLSSKKPGEKNPYRPGE